MLPLFIIFLVSALGSILVALRASHEIPRLLAVASAVLCSIFCFAMTPWPIQLLIFLLILQLERLSPFRRAGEVPIALFSTKQRK